MAANAASNIAQKAMGEVPVSVANEDKQATSGSDMLACCWAGKGKVELRRVPKPDITDSEDVIVKITGTTGTCTHNKMHTAVEHNCIVCGSDLHLYHGELMQLKEGEVLGHEFIGTVEKIGHDVTKVRPGDRVVAAFNIACGKCEWCTKGLFTSCSCANNSSVMDKLYGHRISGVLGYSHVSNSDMSKAQCCSFFIDARRLLWRSG